MIYFLAVWRNFPNCSLFFGESTCSRRL